MGYKTITVKESTYNRLRDWKENGESFSDMFDREMDRRILTGQDALDWSREQRKAGRNPLAQRADSPYRRK